MCSELIFARTSLYTVHTETLYYGGLNALELLVVERRPHEVRRDDSLPLDEDGTAAVARVAGVHQQLRRVFRHLEDRWHQYRTMQC